MNSWQRVFLVQQVNHPLVLELYRRHCRRSAWRANYIEVVGGKPETMGPRSAGNPSRRRKLGMENERNPMEVMNVKLDRNLVVTE